MCVKYNMEGKEMAMCALSSSGYTIQLSNCDTVLVALEKARRDLKSVLHTNQHLQRGRLQVPSPM